MVNSFSLVSCYELHSFPFFLKCTLMFVYNFLNVFSELDSTKPETAVSSTFLDLEQQVVPLSTTISSTPNSCPSVPRTEEHFVDDQHENDRFDINGLFFFFPIFSFDYLCVSVRVAFSRKLKILKTQKFQLGCI